MRNTRAKAIRALTGSRRAYREGKRLYTQLGTSRAQAPKLEEPRNRAIGRNAAMPGWMRSDVPPLLTTPLYDLHRAARGNGGGAGWALRSAMSEVAPQYKQRRHESLDRFIGRLPSCVVQSSVRRAIHILNNVLP